MLTCMLEFNWIEQALATNLTSVSPETSIERVENSFESLNASKRKRSRDDKSKISMATPAPI